MLVASLLFYFKGKNLSTSVLVILNLLVSDSVEQLKPDTEQNEVSMSSLSEETENPGIFLYTYIYTYFNFF